MLRIILDRHGFDLLSNYRNVRFISKTFAVNKGLPTIVRIYSPRNEDRNFEDTCITLPYLVIYYEFALRRPICVNRSYSRLGLN